MAKVSEMTAGHGLSSDCYDIVANSAFRIINVVVWEPLGQLIKH